MDRKTLTLDAFVQQLQQLHGTALRAIVLYGSAASDESVAGVSDINVLVLVNELSLQTLRELGQTVRAWGEAGHPPPLTMTVGEWERSADIFPMEYADILERHKVLYGDAPFDSVKVQLADLRLQVEHEAMSKLLRLRQGVMATGTNPEAQRELLKASFSTLMVIFRAALRLSGAIPPRDRIVLIREVATRGEFSATSFKRVADLVQGTALSDAETPLVLADYVSAMESLVLHLDGFTTPDSNAGDLPN